MKWSVALRLGRVSNLPTVWSNVLAGVVLAGGSAWDVRVIPLLFAASLFYTAGMFLNDAFDWKIDVVERPERPIPSNQVTRHLVMSAGILLLLGGIIILTGIGFLLPSGTGFWPMLSGVVLCGVILWYDLDHKTNPFSPLIMGACRMMVYVTAACAVLMPPSMEVFWGGLVLVSWLIGLTYIAKQETIDHVANLWPLVFLGFPLFYTFPYLLEGGLASMVWIGLLSVAFVAFFLARRHRPGDIGRAVLTLIAGISLLDALFVVRFGDPSAALLAVSAFAVTLFLQRFVPGT